ncbi:uncharacterized protein LOC135207387 [Macrobrachium nipponense]|uniref:uncharacterized protein LOC135207387 n=1 Tax=Macrobrachium nipponense TaxID=159736 RepID=UPI0030C814B2
MPTDYIAIPGYHFVSKDSVQANRTDGKTVMSRGLITYYRKNLAVRKCTNPRLGANTDCLTIGMHDESGRQLFRVCNTYSPAQALDIDSNNLLAQDNPLLIVGDLNAVHPKLGSATGRRNVNGIHLHKYLMSRENNIRILNDAEATHIKGNKLDYICIVGDSDVHNNCEVVDTLTSDHFGIYAEIVLNKTFKRKITARKKINVPKKWEDSIRESMDVWHDGYEARSSDQYNDDIIQKLEEEVLNRTHQQRREPQKPLTSWYNADDAVKRINKQYRKAKKKWMNNPSPENLTIYRRMEKQVQDVKKNSREKYWNKFMQGINEKTPPCEVARRVRIAQGKKNREPLHPNPRERANELMTKWASDASNDALPIKVRVAVEKRIRKKIKKLREALKKAGKCDDKLFTEQELQETLKSGKSTAPGLDGITYNAIRFLTTVSGNPVLKLYNMIWSGQPIPKAWKKSLIIPVPKTRKAR